MESIEPLVGLNKLRKWSELSEDEKNEFLSAHPGYRGRSDEQLSVNYENIKFKEEFGDDEFNKSIASSNDQKANFESRQAAFRHKVLQDTFSEQYKGDPEMESEGRLSKFVSDDAIEHLLRNGYKTQAQQQKAFDDELSSMDPITRAESTQYLESRKKALERESNHIFEEADQLDSKFLKDSSAKTSDEYAQNILNNISANPNNVKKISDEIESFLTQTTDDGTPIFPWYTSYKDSYQFQNITIDDKIKLFSDFLAINDLAKEAKNDKIYSKNVEMVNDYFHHNVAQNTTTGDKWKMTGSAVMTKSAASFMNTGLGAYALYLKLTDEDAFQNFVQGKDKDGNTLDKAFNMDYWNKVDMFNTFDSKDQEKAKINGGLSTFNIVSDVGEEYKLLTSKSFYDATAMMGYGVANIGLDYLMLGLGAGARGAVKQAIKLGIRSGLQTARNGARVMAALKSPTARLIGDFARLQLGSIAESTLEAKNVFDRIVEERNAPDAFPNYLQEHHDEVNSLIEQRIAEKEAGNGKQPEGLRLAHNQIVSDTTLEVINELRDKYNKDTYDAASSAYALEATTKQIKNSIGDGLFRQYLYAKPLKLRAGKTSLKKGSLRFTENGAEAIKPKPMDYVKSGVKSIVGGGLDEYTDEMINNGAYAFGMSLANDYTTSAFDPDSANLVAYNLSAIGAYIGEAEDAMYDPSSFQQAFVGAISPITNVAVSPISAARYLLMDKDTKAKMSAVEKWSSFIYNPLLKESAALNADYRYAETIANTINDAAKDSGEDFKDIMKGLSILDKLTTARTIGDIKETADKEELAAINFLNKLSALSLAGADSPVYTQYMEELNKVANGEITNEQFAQFFASSENEDLLREYGPMAYDIAKEQMQKNAQKFLKLYDDYNAISDYVSETIGDNPDDKGVRSQLIFNTLMKNNWNDRKNKMEKELFGENSVINDNEDYTKGEKTQTAIKDDIEVLDKQIAALEQLKQRVEKKIEEEDGDKKLNKLTLKQTEKDIKSLKAQKEDIEKNAENTRVISAEEILKLSPRARADMLLNEERYTERQREEISKAKDVLIKRDANYQKVANDIAILHDRTKNADESFRRILENKEEFKVHLANEMINNQFEMMTKMMQDAGHKASNELSKLVPRSQRSAGVNFFKKASEYDLGTLKRVKEEHPEFGRFIDDAISVAQLRYDANQIIDNFDIENSAKKQLKQNLGKIIFGSKSKEEALTAIEKFIDSDAPEVARNQIDEIAERLEQLDYTRDHTILETRAQKKREEEDRRRAEEQRKFNENGANFGFPGYKVGDVVYDSTGKEGVIVGFERKTDKKGVETFSALVKFGKSRPRKIKDTAELLKENPIKEKQQEQPQQPVSQPAPTTPEQQPVEKKPVEPEAQEPQVENIEDIRSVNVIDLQSENRLEGNRIKQYDPMLLSKFGILAETGENTIKQFHEWLNTHNIKLQEIIDNELGDIFNENQDIKLYPMFIKPTSGDDQVQNIPFLTIEYTDQVRKHHNEARGGVISFNGKQYLIVGNLGYGNVEQRDQWNTVSKDAKIRRTKYLKDNPDTIFFVDTEQYTQISQIATGLIAHRLPNDEEGKYFSLKELLSPERNPHDVEFEDLKFAIYVDGEYKTVRVSPKDKIINLKHQNDNNGSAFLLIKAADGKYLPVYIRQTSYNELNSGTVKDRIDQAIADLTSQDYNIRQQAVRTLKDILAFNKDANISTYKNGGLKITANGRSVEFDATKSIDKTELMKVISDAHFLINLSSNVFEDTALLEEYDENGLIKLDVASMSTFNATYSVYPIKDGKPVIDEAVSSTNPVNVAENRSGRAENSVLIGGKTYRIIDGKYYDELGKEITARGTKLSSSIYYNHQIQKNNLSPSMRQGDNLYYIIDPSEEHTIVVYRDKNGYITVLSTRQGKDFIAKMQDDAELFDRDQNARAKLKSAQDVDLGLDDESQEKQDNGTQEQRKVIQSKEKNNQKDLQNPKDITTFAGIASSREYGTKLVIAVNAAAKANGVKLGDDPAEYERFVREKLGLPTIGIPNPEDFIKNIKDCKS